MSDIYFQCDCGKALAVDAAGVGRTISCPDCKKPIEIPQPAIQFACVKCGNDVLAPEAIAGKEVKCVNLKSQVTFYSSTGWYSGPPK